MTTQIQDRTEGRPLDAPELESLRPDKLLSIVAIVALLVGGASALGGIVGAVYTYQQAAVEQIVTPDDAAIAGAQYQAALAGCSGRGLWPVHHHLGVETGRRQSPHAGNFDPGQTDRYGGTKCHRRCYPARLTGDNGLRRRRRTGAEEVFN